MLLVPMGTTIFVVALANRRLPDCTSPRGGAVLTSGSAGICDSLAGRRAITVRGRRTISVLTRTYKGLLPAT